MFYSNTQPGRKPGFWAAFALLFVVLFTTGSKLPQGIELQLRDVSMNEYGHVYLTFTNTGCDCRNIRMTIETSGPDQSLTEIVTRTHVDVTGCWQQNTTKRIWVPRDKFVEYAIKCKITVQCDEGKKEYLYPHAKPETGDYKPVIYYVHGYEFKTAGEDVVMNYYIKEMFPGCEYKYYKWDATPAKWDGLLSATGKFFKETFNNGLKKLRIYDADKYVNEEKTYELFGKYFYRARDEVSEKLAAELCEMPAEQREKVILIGHSLGGIAVIRAMEILAKKGMRIDRGIFLGTPLPCDETGMNMFTTALNASKRYNINIYNEKDEALELFKDWLPEKRKGDSLGANGTKKSFPRQKLLQVRGNKSDDTSSWFDNHLSTDYLLDLEKFYKVYREILPEE